MTSAPRISCPPSPSCPSPCPGEDPNTTSAPSPSFSTACAAAPRSGPPHADFGPGDELERGWGNLLNARRIADSPVWKGPPRAARHPFMAAAESQLRTGKASPPTLGTMHTTDYSLQPRTGARDRLAPRPAQVEIVIPVRNEERDLGPSVRRLRAYLDACFPFAARITIADNGSTDGTWARALELARELPQVRAVRIERPGRGGALRSVWAGSTAEVCAYMDVDLSTDLNALLPLVAPLLSGHSEVAIGTRLARAARVIRGPKREIISRCYNLLLHASLGTRFSDAQCGFKAIRADAARAAYPRNPGGLDRRPGFAGESRGHGPGRPARHRAARHRPGPRHDPGARTAQRPAAAGGGRPGPPGP